ncbi:hypothetical protein OHS18_47360 [Amycolatopsis sp. NBC_00355]|uniref:hypothetical protein n=1 Tax=Amycolatopsis sp. NBC_00355 TaxID=2975957 RepID=UPI002E274662
MKPAKVPGIPPQLPLDAARDLMDLHRIDHLPVVEARHCVLPGQARVVDGRVARVAALPAGPARDQAVHDVRKAAKPELRAFQDLLGEFQDAEAATAARCSAELPAAWHDLRGDLRPLWT